MWGQAALAMWWDMAPDIRDEFEHWHSHEHFPERLGLPGFQRASRWADAAGGEGFFVLYELATYEALVSPEYQARLNAPSDWSRRMMPHHRNMVRSQCRVLEQSGGAVAGHALTVRLSPVADASAPWRENLRENLRAHLRTLVHALPLQAGLTGAVLLQTDTPAIAPTTEQAIRGHADIAADWVLVVTGYDAAALTLLEQGPLSRDSLEVAGASQGTTVGAYQLRLTMVDKELS